MPEFDDMNPNQLIVASMEKTELVCCLCGGENDNMCFPCIWWVVHLLCINS